MESEIKDVYEKVNKRLGKIISNRSLFNSSPDFFKNFILPESLLIILSGCVEILKNKNYNVAIENLGFSINYESPLTHKGRFSYKGLNTFCFDPSSNVEKVSLNEKHELIERLKIFYTLLAENKEIFSIRDYYKRKGHRETLFNINSFESSLEYDDFLQMYSQPFAESPPKYYYEHYFNYLSYALFNKKKLVETTDDDFWHNIQFKAGIDANKWNPNKIFNQYSITIDDHFTSESRLNILIFSSTKLEEPLLHDLAAFLDHFSPIITEAEYKFTVNQLSLRTAVISILVDSYSHNISAHSLSALQWYFRNRSENYLERKVDLRAFPKIRGWFPENLDRTRLRALASTAENYYEVVGLDDQNNTKDFISLADFLRFSDTYFDDLSNQNKYQLLTFADSKNVTENIALGKDVYKPGLPVPIDNYIWTFLRFLQEKGAFWTGVLKDNAASPGISYNFYDLIYTDFICNPLFLGTIAHSEGITKINVHLLVLDSKGDAINEQTSFAIIDLSAASSNSRQSHEATYNFVRPGSAFKNIREILQGKSKETETYNIFLPGGVVGKQAFYTIIENTLRNVKHYAYAFEKLRKEGIDLYISIAPHWMYIDPKEKNSLKFMIPESNAMYQIGVWIEYPIDAVKDSFDVWHALMEKSCKSVLDEKSTPLFGGNSQDKICAGMLLNGNFTSADKISCKRDWYYYPYIHYTLNSSISSKENHEFYYCESYADLKDKNDEPIEFLTKEDDLVEVKIKNYDSKRKSFVPDGGNVVILRKWFHVWKAGDFFKYKNERNADDDLQHYRNSIMNRHSVNFSRFKVVQYGTPEEFDNYRYDGVVRLIKRDIGNKDLSTAYEKWINGWLGNDVSISYGKDSKQYKILNPNNFELQDCNDQIATIQIVLAHGSDGAHGKSANEICNFRSHGSLAQKFFGTNIPDKIVQLPQIEKLKAIEFYETIATRIHIIDNRLADRLITYSKKEVLNKQLMLYYWNEEGNDDYKREYKNRVTGDRVAFKLATGNMADLNILIVHLSYIEAMGYTEKRFGEFVKTELMSIEDFFDKPSNKFRDNFLFVVTTGRGRDEWRKNIEDENYIGNFISIPIESLESAIEDGVVYRDDFQIKYNLMKIIMGS